ncbi:MAG TPA: endonuclease/exonuclease/phosphatase family protein [Candidatus Marinimicrobia bacterium]|jgi:predicted extracellular nuclease|nr:endonuclease/exonuclease/phosphatase family protein [Candidatus Neomarinimicrobiota bacterium]MDP7217137.1 endonuclease/exonuclease/phosphatase family protein [Candidatus Neomarinimicrobiota bacterium]MDP7437805.1 endonuclease/exonuclease/phosphatase family protein [Candidatus Neomarinimicrobiota bacterium]HBN46029.1 endonuclease [Candidatus Neomarinimicrobiota bacterium]HJM70637.1 endonuclease/exonuclease/phosphatase family protein [Candidatus Neomarinimicrobiota bacterium]|tara:strand:+ start:26557 stop:27501 length:945 start_codon:yes stop_codon:yes gene_type:complete
MNLKYLITLFWLFTVITGQSLRVGFWNVENLFDLEDDPTTRDEEFALGGKKNVTQEVYDLKLKNCAYVLEDLNADVLGLCEVENHFVLDELNRAYSGRNYEIIHYDSPDSRGIDNALLYDASLFKVTETKPINNTLPSGKPTRDILYVKGEYKGQSLHIYVNHWPSNYGGKEQAIPKRRATARLLANEVADLLSNDPDAEILLIGDFNEEPTDENVRILKSVDMTSLMEPLMGQPQVGTYVYRGKDNFLDQMIISAGLQDDQGLTAGPAAILDKPKYRQQEGKYAHYPFRFWAGNHLLGGYSDHLAVFVEIYAK